MQYLRTRAVTQRLLRLLALLLLLQGVFPVQLHTLLKHDDQGTLVQVCTLEGAQTVELDENGKPVHDSTQDAGRSAAIVFSQLMAAALPGINVPALTQPDLPAFSSADIPDVVFPEPASGLLPIRAPPIA